MSSKWNSVAQSWLSGTAKLDELVVETALEGELHNLAVFLRQHPSPLDPVTVGRLNSYACKCAYPLLGTQLIERGIHVLRNVSGEDSVERWLKDALLWTLDGSIRTKIADYLRRHNLLAQQDEVLLSRYDWLKEIYSVDSYQTALARSRTVSQSNLLPKLDTLLNSFLAASDPNIVVEADGLSVDPRSLNIWLRLEEGDLKELFPIPGRRQGRQGSPLFFNAALHWLRKTQSPILDRIVLEGEIMSSHPGRSSVTSRWDSPDTKWRAEMQLYISKGMVDQCLSLCSDIPGSCTAPGTLSVMDNGREVMSLQVRTLAFDIESVASVYSFRQIQRALLKKEIWTKTRFNNPAEWIGLLAKSGIMFGAETFNLLHEKSVLHLITRFCIQSELPLALQCFLEGSRVPVDLDTTQDMLDVAKDCIWAQWLILSRIPQQSYAATIINARSVLAKEGIYTRSIADLAQADSIYIVLAALSHSPRPLTETLSPQSVAPDNNLGNLGDMKLVDGILCPVEPICSITDIEPRLHEKFPKTCQALQVIAREGQERGLLTHAEFQQWRNQILRTELDDCGFFDMVMTSGVQELEDLLYCSQYSRDSVDSMDQQETAKHWEFRHLAKLRTWIDSICAKEAPEGVSIGICQNLIAGRPIAALEFFLELKGNPTQLEAEDLKFLELLSRIVAIWNFKDSTVVFSALIFSCACGLDTSKIQIDVTAMLKLGLAQNNPADIDSLVEDLVTEVVSEYDEKLRPAGIGFVSGKLLGLLENAVLSGGSLKPLLSSISSLDPKSSPALSPSTDVMLKWSLVHAFANLHHQIPTKRLLERLAQADDWILFLAEANHYQSSIDEVILIAGSMFSDPYLGHHVCYILERKHSIDRTTSSLSSKASGIEKYIDKSGIEINQRPVSEELFDILLEAEQSGAPVQALLKWARNLKWRLLTVAAACYTPTSHIQCLKTWLQIGIKTEREKSKSEGIIEDLMSVVYRYCTDENFEELLEGFALFPIVPLTPLKHFMSALQHFVKHMFTAASQFLTAFEDCLDKEVRGAKLSPGESTESISVPVDLDLVGSITQSAAMAVLRKSKTNFEREKLLESLVKMEIDQRVDWLTDLSVIDITYKMLSIEADECIPWQDGSYDMPVVNVLEVLEKLLKKGKWIEAREWAARNDFPVDDITKAQAEKLIDEWAGLGLKEELSEILWEEINEVFVDYGYPSLTASLFYLRQASVWPLNCMKHLLYEALKWLDGSYAKVTEQAPRLTEQLTRTLYIIDDEGDIIPKLPCKVSASPGSRNEKCPAVQMVLRPVAEVSTTATSEFSTVISGEMSCNSSSSMDRDPPRAISRADAPVSPEEKEGLEILDAIIPEASEAQVKRAIKVLLDCGQIEAAENIQETQKLNAQIEFFLVETALTIVHKCGSNGWNGESAEKIVLLSILRYLRKKNFLDETREPLPQDILDAVAAACRDSGGHPVCARASITFRAATLLNMSCTELASYGPNKALELLLLKGERGSEIAKDFVSAFEFSPRATAKRIAQIYLSSLMGARSIHSINEDEPEDYNINMLRSNSNLISGCGICSDWAEIGNALMQLLVERHAVLTAEIEADILVRSYECYERVAYVEGLDVLLELASSRVRDFAADEKLEAMIRVTVGICRFDGLSQALDVIVQNKKLDLLFQDANSHNPAIMSTLRSAILAAIYKNSPKDSQTLNVTYRHFNMHAEVGQGIKDKAMELLDQCVASGRVGRDPRLTKAMDLLIRAGAEFSCAQCSASAADCASLVALVAQQICFPERQWIRLSDSEVRDLLPTISDITSALIVARAYKYNSPQDWVLTLWQHMLHISTVHARKSTGSSSLERVLKAMHSYATSVMQEISFSDDQLEQIMQMYLACQGEGDHTGTKINRRILNHCIFQFLNAIVDVKKRYALCKMMPKDQSDTLVRDCETILDIYPK